jgi:ATP-dependent protease ClpP protease subunit
MNRFNRKLTGHTSLLFDYGIDIENRRIWLMDDICETEFEATACAFHYFNSDPDKKYKPIELIICSNGGSVETMFGFYDLIRSSESPVHTIVIGTACSAAVLVAICADKRYATENAHMMHHSSKAFSDDLSEKELESRASIIKDMADRTYKLLSLHSFETEAWWRKGAQHSGEIWMTAEEMLIHGCIDGIIPNKPYKKLRRPRVIKKKVEDEQAPKQKSERPKPTKPRKKQN